MKGACGTVKLKVPTKPAASVAFVLATVKTFVPVLFAAAPPAPGVPGVPSALVQFPWLAAVEIWLLTKDFIYLVCFIF